MFKKRAVCTVGEFGGREGHRFIKLDRAGRLLRTCRTLTNALFGLDVGKCLVIVFCSGIL